MANVRFGHSIAVAACLSSFASAQDEAETCYGPGSVVGAVVGSSIITIGLLVTGFFLYKMYWKNRKGKHLVLMTDAETPHDQYAFDNPCFREATPIKHNIEDEKRSSKLEKIKWPGWPPVYTFGKEKKSEKITSMDDSYVNDSQVKVVTLKSHDFTGLGFNICGNMRDGIFVKDVLHRGPAFESGRINTGDRIDSVCISFRNMVFEDALTILSYASPYDVQVQVENDSYSRPSTLMRSKRESNAVNSSDKIFHPKFNRSQSFFHLNEIEKSNNKKLGHQMGTTLEKNRINQSLNKSQDLVEFANAKASSPGSNGKPQKNALLKTSLLLEKEKSQKTNCRLGEDEARQVVSVDSQNKLQKFGIKVLPITINPKMGVQSMTGKKPAKSPTTVENEINTAKENPIRSSEHLDNVISEEEKISGLEEQDSNKENVKTILAKGFMNLKGKINQNTLGKRRKEEAENAVEEEAKGDGGPEGECPVPRLRSSVTCGVKAYEKSQQNQMNVPEEVSRAGDAARNNRKSTAETRKTLTNSEMLSVDATARPETVSDSEGSSDRDSMKDDAKKPRRSKGKAPAPPKQSVSSKEIDEIKKESELMKDEMSIFEPEAKMIALKEDEGAAEESPRPSYESDSDAEPVTDVRDASNTKIELNTTQVTVHQSSTSDTNDDEVEPNRKAASLGDLSKLDSDQPLSVVLERAVSLDLTEGSSQCGKKRKAPLPPSEEFPAVFEGLIYRKEPRLEGLNTFQRRLKKSSDFGTLEDAISDGPRSLDVEPSKHSPLDVTEAHNYNIQEFSSWLAECRKPKGDEEAKGTASEDKFKMNSTSLVNINSSDYLDEGEEREGKHDFQGINFSFSVNGKNFRDFQIQSSPENVNPPGANSRTVLVISQPNSLEPSTVEKILTGDVPKEGANGGNSGPRDRPESFEDVSPPKLPTSPAPKASTVSTPLSSTLTYITEIKVSTSEGEPDKLQPEDRAPEFTSVGEKIQKFDSLKTFDDPSTRNHFSESSKIPIRTMKSETGQKVLATIQSLAKESSPTKTPEVEYAKRVASLFSTSQKSQANARNNDASDNEISARSNASSFLLKASPPKPSKDYSPTRKVPPVVPPRKMETSLESKSFVTVELPSSPRRFPDSNVITWSSFAGRNQNESSRLSRTVSKAKEHEEMNGREERVAPTQEREESA